MSSNQFYASIPAFDDFSGIADSDNYRLAPDDWHVIIADVKGSTRAIAEGRYKDVNMIGAACINAVLNISQKRSVPYVFGGDGATLQLNTDSEIAIRAENDIDPARSELHPVLYIHRGRACIDYTARPGGNGKFKLNSGNTDVCVYSSPR